MVFNMCVFNCFAQIFVVAFLVCSFLGYFFLYIKPNMETLYKLQFNFRIQLKIVGNLKLLFMSIFFVHHIFKNRPLQMRPKKFLCRRRISNCNEPRNKYQQHFMNKHILIKHAFTFVQFCTILLKTCTQNVSLYFALKCY